MEMFLSVSSGPLGLHVFVDNFVDKANNLVRGLSDGRLRAVQAHRRGPIVKSSAHPSGSTKNGIRPDRLRTAKGPT